MSTKLIAANAQKTSSALRPLIYSLVPWPLALSPLPSALSPCSLALGPPSSVIRLLPSYF